MKALCPEHRTVIKQGSAADGSDAFHFADFQLFAEKSLLLREGKPVKVGSRALLILVTLVERAGQIVSNRELVDVVWPDTCVDESNLRVHMTSLRRLLGDEPGHSRFILNVPGRGYQFIAPVQRSAVQEERAAEPVIGSSHPAAGKLVGRDDILDRLVQMLPARRLVTILGPGGIGKTALVQALAARWASETQTELCFVDLAPVSDGSLVASTFAALLDVPVISPDPMPNILQALRRTTRLVVFDSCEQVIDAVAEICEGIISEVESVRVVTTSREPLRASGEWIQRLQPLASPAQHESLSREQVLSFPAVQLFVERALAISDSFAPDEEELQALCELCRRLDGLPLAIELAAARIDMFGPKELAKRLDNQLSLLSRGLRTAVPRHRTIRATIDWSYQLLPPGQKSLLGRLSVFAGPFSLKSASALAAAPATDPADLIEPIVHLVEQSLIVAETAGSSTSYRLLGTTRAFAAEKLEEAGERETVREWHARHMLDLLGDAEEAAAALQSCDWSSAYSGMIDDVRSAMDWSFAAGRRIDLAIRLAAASAPLWFRHSLVDEYRQRLEQALARLPELDIPDLESEMLLNTAMGHALWHTRGPEGAEACFRRAIDLAGVLGDVAAGRTARWGLWLAYTMKGRTDAALEVAGHCGLEEPSGDLQWQLAQERMLALTLHFAGRHEEALHYVEHVLSQPSVPNVFVRNSGFQFDQMIAAKALHARLLWLRGHPERAFAIAKESAEEAQSLGHSLSYCYNLAQGICPIAIWTGDLETARHYTDALLDHSARRVLPYWHGWGQHYDRALNATSSGTGARPEHVHFDMALQTHYHLETVATLAASLADDVVLEGIVDGPPSWCSPELLRIRALRVAETDPQQAELLLLRAVNEARAQGTLSWELRAAISLAEHKLARGSLSGLQALRESYDRFVEGFSSADLRRARAVLEMR